MAAALASLPGWRLERDALCKSWRFPSFRAAIAAMTAAAPEIDTLDHHPEWSNVYDRLSVRLTTHDAGDRVSARDVALAGILDRSASAHAGNGDPHAP